MMELHASYAGPMISKTAKHDPIEIMIRVIDENPGLSRSDTVNLAIEELKRNEDYLDAALRHCCLNLWNALHPIHSRNGRKPRWQRAEAAAQAQQTAADYVQQIKRAVISDLIMPNNKTVADCTGMEMAKFSKFGAKVAKICGRRKVGAVLSEEQLWKLWQESKK